jgi:hypothetical protein
MKRIQVSPAEGILEALSELAKLRRLTPSILIREACAKYMPKLKQEALEHRYAKGYQRKPESPSIGKLGEKMAREVWPQDGFHFPSSSSSC